jgi:hypothetical protein
MSVRQNISDWVSGKPTTKVAAPTVSHRAPAQPPPPAFLIANIKPDTDNFLLVFGEYNFAVAKSFAQPVVGLLNDWVPAYANMHPFAGMERAEVIISRVPPEQPGGATDANPSATAAAAKSADRDTNIRMLISLARDGWIHERCILSTAGVFAKAQDRYESRNFPTLRAAYIKQFVPLPASAREIATLCMPPAPARPLSPPALHPARQICKSQSEWDSLRDENRARLIAAEQSQWQNQYAPSFGNSSRGRTDLGTPAPLPGFDEITSGDGAKMPPTDEERIGTSGNDWK